MLPLLTEFDVAFKLPATLSGVIALGAGSAGRTQIGKILTVYPASDTVLREVVECLDAAWRPDGAPAIPSDLPVGSGSGLWVRYGAFERSGVVVDAFGRLHPGIEGPDGVTRPDVRDLGPAEPRWFGDPPVLAGDPVPRADPSAVITVDGQDFLPLKRLSDRAGGSVFLALRTHDLQLVVIRKAVPGVGCDEFGNDAVSRLRNEHSVLRDFAMPLSLPKVVAYDEAAHVLVTEEIAGRSLEAVAVPDGVAGLPYVARTLARLHQAGLVHRDVKPPNVLFAGQEAHLVDFELAARDGEEFPIVGGTPGYLPFMGEYSTVHPAQDVHGLGACLTYVLLRSCPGRLPRASNAGRQIGLLRLTGQHTAARLVTRLTHPDPAQRPSAEQAAKLLAESQQELLSQWRAGSSPARVKLASWHRTAPLAAGAAARAFAVPARRGHSWRNTHQFAGLTCQGINLGAAGIVIALASIDEALGTSCFNGAAIGAAEWLSNQPSYEQAHGLFTGNAGVAVALALSGRRYGRPDLVEAARRRFVAAASHDAADFDLFSGAAGIVWSGCILAEVLHEKWPLELAHHQVERIHRHATNSGRATGWRASPDFDASRPVYFGAAHGASGVALALASWGALTRSPESTALAAEVFSGIHAAARSADGENILVDDSGREHAPQSWCHGVNGFVWCLEQAFGGSRALEDVRRWAADAILHVQPVMQNPTLCHGTAGTLEVFRMLTADARVAPLAARRATQAVAILRLLHQRTPAGTVWSSENPAIVTPDLWVGFLGPAASVALHAGRVRESVISLAWLRRCAQPVKRPGPSAATAPQLSADSSAGNG
ncbi:lanthionine synthetase LanC family protein [Nonomuraea dietziae]|uniref:lanthionine synthetase LanC family protein n=1 Tax=Nonomuraea dietziae TaxID=65515 RepID=UPI0033CBB182